MCSSDLAQLEREKEEFKIVVNQSDRYVIRYEINEDKAYTIGETMTLFYNKERIDYFTKRLLTNGTLLEESHKDFKNFIKNMQEGTMRGECHLHVQLPDGKICWMHTDYTLISDKRGASSIISFYDDTALREKKLTYERWKNYFEVSSIGSSAYMEVNLSKNRIESTQEDTQDNYKKSPLTSFSETIEREAINEVYEEDRLSFIEFFNYKRLLTLYHGGVYEDSLEYRMLQNNTPNWYSTSVHMVMYPESDEVMAFIMSHNIHQKKCEIEQLAQQASRDSLTQLLNRHAMQKQVLETLAHATAEDTFVMYVVDVDNFKLVNDTNGHQAGDKLLQELAETLDKLFKEDGMVGRIGGDEFMIFCHLNHRTGTLESKSEELLKELQFWIEDIWVTVSIGACMTKGRKQTFEELYGHADAALYSVKRRGKGNYAVWGDNS